MRCLGAESSGPCLQAYEVIAFLHASLIMLLRNTPLIFLVAFLGCGRTPDLAFTPPEQHFPTVMEVPSKYSVAMNDSTVSDYIVRDIDTGLQAGVWRWTFSNPELRYFLTDTENLGVEIDFGVIEGTLKDTGPETVSVYVNGQRLGAIKCATPGDYKFTKRIPSHWLNPNDEATLRAEVRPVWKSPDGRKLALILTQAGFVRTSR